MRPITFQAEKQKFVETLLRYVSSKTYGGVDMHIRKTIFIMVVVLALIFAGCVPQEGEAPSGEQASGGESSEQNEESVEIGGESVSIKAIYIGRMDPSFVEIMQDGEYSSYMFHQDGQAAREAGEMENYSAVDIRYIENEEGRRQIESMERADAPGVGNAPEIAFEGEVEDMFGAGVCMVEGDPYHLAYELLLSSSRLVEEGDYISFDYYVDDYGRKVITTYEKRHTDTGRFESANGTTIFVKLTGNPDEIDSKPYEMSSEAFNMMQGLELNKGEAIKFQYIVEQSGLKRIVSLERMK